MKNTFLIIFSALSILSVTTLWGQSAAIAAFETQAKGYNIYLYQSLIRTINAENNDDFNKLIKNLDHLRFIMTDSIGNASITLYRQLEKGLAEEGFEKLITYENASAKAIVYANDSEESASKWVVIFNLGTASGLFEMEGTVDMKYMNSLSNLNYQSLQKMIPQMNKFNNDFKEEFDDEY